MAPNIFKAKEHLNTELKLIFFSLVWTKALFAQLFIKILYTSFAQAWTKYQLSGNKSSGLVNLTQVIWIHTSKTNVLLWPLRLTLSKYLFSFTETWTIDPWDQKRVCYPWATPVGSFLSVEPMKQIFTFLLKLFCVFLKRKLELILRFCCNIDSKSLN